MGLVRGCLLGFGASALGSSAIIGTVRDPVAGINRCEPSEVGVASGWADYIHPRTHRCAVGALHVGGDALVVVELGAGVVALQHVEPFHDLLIAVAGDVHELPNDSASRGRASRVVVDVGVVASVVDAGADENSGFFFGGVASEEAGVVGLPVAKCAVDENRKLLARHGGPFRVGHVTVTLRLLPRHAAQFPPSIVGGMTTGNC